MPATGALIFDMDGVLIDSEPAWQAAEIRVLGQLGVPLTHALAQQTTGWRIDRVVEYWRSRYPFDAPTPDVFFSWPKARQADLVFSELFVRRTPLSEACRGVVTALAQLGLTDELREARRTSDLSELRRWFSALDRHEYLERVFVDARLKYAVMTNIPFAPEEARHWLGGDGAAPPPLTPRLKTALRVDPLLAGDWIGICAALSRASPPREHSVAGLVAYLDGWVAAIRPLYLMASTPAGFSYAPSRPGEPPPAAGQPTSKQLIEEVLLPLATRHNLPIALKVGAVRGANPALRSGGDGVEVADLSFLRLLCVRNPGVKFLATVRTLHHTLKASNANE